MYKTLGVAATSLAMFSAFAQTAPYAGQQHREIKSLPAPDVAELLAGQGMGLAKAAELNGYPGPVHVLENADALALTAGQRQSTRTLLDRHKDRARRIGAALVASERALDHAFVSRQIDETSLSGLMADIGKLQAELREEHLRTHLKQTALLNQDQIQRYAVLRGYHASGHPHHRP